MKPMDVDSRDSRTGFRLLISPWSRQFADTLGRAQTDLFISSPFVNAGGVRALAEAATNRTRVNLTLLTSLTPQNISNGVTDPSALSALYELFSRVRISSLPRLHAKVYIVDQKIGIITSANLTSGGLGTNFEYGVEIDQAATIVGIREDMNRYFSLGNILTPDVLHIIAGEANNLINVKREAEKALSQSGLAARLRRASAKIELELLQNRVREGRTVNSILSETVLYALEKRGAQTTKELHEFVQPIHPDICDDSADRIINGEHFGKRWKHLVRSAQQYLKRRGLIDLHDGKWHLSDKGARL